MLKNTADVVDKTTSHSPCQLLFALASGLEFASERKTSELKDALARNPELGINHTDESLVYEAISVVNLRYGLLDASHRPGTVVALRNIFWLKLGVGEQWLILVDVLGAVGIWCPQEMEAQQVAKSRLDKIVMQYIA